MVYHYIDNEKFTNEVHEFNLKNNPLKYYNEIYDFYVKEMHHDPILCDDWYRIFDIYFDYRMKVVEKSYNKRMANTFSSYDKENLDLFRTNSINEINEFKKIMKNFNPTEGRKKTLTPNNYIGKCFMDIANKIASSGNYYRYTWKEEMVGDGIEQSLRYMHNFSKVKTTRGAFNYFSTIISYAFLRRIAAEKKQVYVKYNSKEYYQTIAMNDCMEDLSNDFAFSYMDNLDYEI